MSTTESRYVTIEFLSDWHIGTGAGVPGGPDRLVFRDADGLPAIPAMTITGLWRDAAERLAQALDGTTGREWHGLVVELFGSEPTLETETVRDRPRGALLSIGTARLPESLRRLVLPGTPHATRLRDAATFLRPGVRIDETTGRAMDEHFRTIEMARSGLTLTAELTLAMTSKHELALSFLIAAANLVDRIGGGRRHGSGRCRMNVTGGTDTLSAINMVFRESPPAVTNAESSQASTTAITPHAGEWVRLPFELKLLGPVAVTERRLGNVWTSLDFIPGTVLLPEITRGLSAKVRQAVFSGDFRIRDIYPAVEHVAGRPTPHGIYQKKDSDSVTFDPTTDLVNRLTTTGDETLKPRRGGYVGRRANGSWPPTVAPTTVIRTHNAIDDTLQRPNANGGLFSYEALASRAADGTPSVFRGEVLFRSGVVAADDVKRPLHGRKIRIGRSRKDDYGECQLSFLDTEPVSTSSADIATGSVFTVWLLSDALLRDDRHRYDPTVAGLIRALAKGLQISAQQLQLDSPVETLGAAVQLRRRESWHSRWGLPRPTLPVIRAGSCFRLRTETVITASAIAEVHAAGIGERRAEGFGDLTINDPLVSQALKGSPVRHRQSAISVDRIADSDPDFKVARWLETWAAESLITTNARIFAYDVDLDTGNVPLRETRLHWRPASDVNGVKLPDLTLIQELPSGHDVNALVDWFSQRSTLLEKKWPAEAYHRLKLLFNPNEGLLWECLALTDSRDWPTFTITGVTALKQTRWAFALRALLAEVVQSHRRGASS